MRIPNLTEEHVAKEALRVYFGIPASCFSQLLNVLAAVSTFRMSALGGTSGLGKLGGLGPPAGTAVSQCHFDVLCPLCVGGWDQPPGAISEAALPFRSTSVAHSP